MHEQDRAQTPTSETIDCAAVLERRKRAILALIDEMSLQLPPMVQLMVKTYRSTVSQFVDNLTYEQSEMVIDKVQEILDGLRG